MLSQRATTLLFSCISALSSGTNYSFSSYAPQLAERLHLSSLAINIVGAAGNAGVYLSGPLVGIVVDRKGPRVVLLAAAVCLLVGYAGLYSLFRGGEEGPYAAFGLGGLAFCQVLTGVGGSGALAAAVKATSLSFSKARRGAAMATVLSCFGLSAFFYSTVSHAIVSDDPTSEFLLTLALGCGLSIFLGALFVHPPPLHGQDPTASSSARGQYLAISTADDELASAPSRTHSPYRPAPSASEFSLHSDIQPALHGRRSMDEHPVPDGPSSRRRQRSASPLLAKEREAEHVPHGAGDLNLTGWQLMRQKDFWGLWCFLGLCSGVGLMFINNIGLVALTLSSSDGDPDPRSIARSQAHLVSLLSVFNCLGRLFVGFASDTFLHHVPQRMRFARVWWLVVTSLLFVLSQYLAGSATHVAGLAGLALPTALVGFAYGTLFGSVPVVGLERFGVLNYGTNNGFLTLSPSVFANLSNLLFGAVYDAHVPRSPSALDGPSSANVSSFAKRAGDAAPAHLCQLGAECFHSAFQATTVMSVLAVMLAVMLARRRSFHPVYHT
ncbi:hypothetical protein JCM10213_008867 [Rhodosporidiobolus nylandii]